MGCSRGNSLSTYTGKGYTCPPPNPTMKVTSCTKPPFFKFTSRSYVLYSTCFSLSTLVQLKRIQTCCSIGAVCTNSFLDHTESRRWTVFKIPGWLCPDNEVPGGHSWTANWRIHFRQLIGNTFHSRNLSTNIDLRSCHGNIAKQRDISIYKVIVIREFHYSFYLKNKKRQKVLMMVMV